MAYNPNDFVNVIAAGFDARIASVEAKAVTWDSTINLVIVGNSFIQGIGATTGNFLGDQIRAQLPFLGSGASSTVIGRSGFSWPQLDGIASTIDAAFVAGKTNILLVGETTNSVMNTPYYDAATTAAQAKTFVANRRASKAWARVVIFGTIPRRDTNRSNANTVVANAILDTVDADMRSYPTSYGADLFIDVRTGTAFAFSDYTDASFQAASAFFSEANPNQVHPNNAGYGLIAGKIAAALKFMPLPKSSPISGATPTPTPTPTPSVASLTMSSPTYGTGKFSQGMSGGTATVPSSVQPLNAGVPFTAECWVSFSGSALGVAIGQRTSTGAHAWYIGATGAGLVQASVYSSGSGHDIVSSVNIKDGAFHHLALVVQATSTQLYIDGALAGSNAFTVDAATLAAEIRQLSIGGGPFAWVGVVDEVVYTSGAKYTGAFTPPTAITPTGLANTRGIYRLDGDGTGVA